MANIAYGEITILDLLDDATYIYYANDGSGDGASLSPTGKSYIGIYSGAALSTGQPAPNTQEYTDIKGQINWSKYVGEDGEPGKDGTSINQNLYTGSAQFSGEWVNRNYYSDTQTVDSLGNKILVRGAAWAGIYQRVPASKGQTFTWSGNIRSSEQVTLHLYFIPQRYDSENEKFVDISSGSASINIAVTTEEKRYSGSFTVNTNNCEYICARVERDEDNEATFYISSLKLEHGDIATEWCPAINGIISTTTTYQLGESATTAPSGNWSVSPPALESGKFLWTKTELLLEDGTMSVSYSVGAKGDKGEDGKDGDKYVFVPNYEKIAKIETSEGTDWTPSELSFSVYEITNNQVNQALIFPVDFINESKAWGYKVQIKLGEDFWTIPNNLIYLLNSDNEQVERYFIHGGLEISGSYLTNSATIYFELEQFYKNLNDMLKPSSTNVSLFAIDANNQTQKLLDLDKSVLKKVWEALVDTEGYIRIVLTKNGEEVAYKPINFSYGVTKAIALFSVNADGINAAVDKNKLSFDENGLTIQNGGFRIYQDEIKPNIFNAEPTGFKDDITYYIMNEENVYVKVTESFSPEKEYYIAQTIKDDDNNDVIVYTRANDSAFISNSSFSEGVTYYELANGIYTITQDKAPVLGKIYYTNIPNLILSATAENGLYINGNGTFKGSINADSGYFKGEITASSGTIGGFIIEDGFLRSLSNTITLNGLEGKLSLANALFDSLTLNGGATLYGQDANQDEVFIVENKEKAATYLAITKDGLLKVGESIIIDGINGTIRTVNYNSDSATGWSISSDLAEFNNINVRGKITSSVFESGKVSSVGGILLIRPSTLIKEISDDKMTLTLEDSSGFDVGHSVYFGDSDYGYISNINGNQITLAAAVLVKEGDVITSFGKTGSIGLGINGAETNASAGTAIIPQQSFSVFEWTQNEDTTGKGIATAKIILGKLPTGGAYKPFENKFGLYAENVLLKGSLVTNSSNSYSGISTLVTGGDAPKSSAVYFKDNSEILFWAGAKGTTSADIQESPFYVDRKGNLYAGSGYFEGTIISKAKITAATLQATRIMGDVSDTAALQIMDNIGIAIYGDVTSDADNALDGKTPDVEIGASWIKMSKNNSSISIKDNVSITETAIYVPKAYLNSKTSKLYMYANKEVSKEVEATGLTFSMAEASVTDTGNYDFTDDFSIEEWSAGKADNRTLSVLGGKSQLLTFSKQDVLSSVSFGFKESITYGEKMEYRKVTDSSNKTIGYDLYI